MIERELRKYIVPGILATVGTSAYIMADTYFIAKAAGADGIAALNLTLPVYSLIFAMGWMIAVGSAIGYSLNKSRDPEGANRYFSNAVVWSLLIGLIFVAIARFAAEPLFRLLGADDTMVAVGLPYMRTVLYFAPPYMLSPVISTFVRNDGSPKIAMAATFSGGIFNIIFDYVFMFVLDLGLYGAALATGLSPAVTILICMIHYFSESNSIRFVAAAPSARKLLRSCLWGISAFIADMANGIATLVFNFLLLRLGGNTAVAAYGIVANFAIIAAATFNGVAQGLQPLASQMHGENKPQAEARIYRHALKISLMIAVLFIAVVYAMTGTLVDIFNAEDSAVLRAYSEPGMRIYFTGYLFYAVNLIREGFFSAVDRPKTAMAISVSRGILAITVFAFVLSRIWGVTGVWLAFPAAELFTFAVTALVLRRRARVGLV